jgi:proline iminopeptidase
VNLHFLYGFLVFISLLSCDAHYAYKIGNVKRDMAALRNPYPNSINKNDGYLTMSDSCQIHYRIDGKGKPILVIHGGPGEPYKKSWESLKLLNQKYSFIYYDQRGCGKSSRCINHFTSHNWNICHDKLSEKLGIERGLKDIEEIRQILGVNKITLVGHSYGAILAALYSIEFKDNVQELILVSPAPCIRYPLEEKFDLFSIIAKELSPTTRKEFESYGKNLWNFDSVIIKNEKELSSQNSYFFHFYDEYHRNIGFSNSVSLIDNLVDKENVGGWLPYAYAWSLPGHFDYRQYLRKIKASSLIIWGDRDICQDSWIKEFSDFIPQAKTIQMKNSAHFLFEENPTEFSKIIDTFLSYHEITK